MTDANGNKALLVLRRVRMRGHAVPVDILVRGNRIADVVPAAEHTTAEHETTPRIVDVDGLWAIPGLVDAHAHLDKTLVGLPYWPNPGGRDVLELANTEREARPSLPGSVQQRVELLLGRLVALGTTHIRTHVDIDTTAGLNNLLEVLAARATFADRIDIQTVAFPQSGLLRRPGTAELMAAALEAGADVVGGLDPAGVDADPNGHLDIVFGLAERTGRLIDIHLHDPGELGAWELAQIAQRTVAHGMQGMVTVSHAMAIAEVDPTRRRSLLEHLAISGVSVATVAPGRGLMLPTSEMHAAGVNLACGNDGVRDMWNPHATGDMLSRAKLLAYRSGYRTDEDIALALTAATEGGARALRIDDYGLSPGSLADIVLVPGETIGDVVVTSDQRRWVIKNGAIVSSPDDALITEAIP